MQLVVGHAVGEGLLTREHAEAGGGEGRYECVGTFSVVVVLK